MAEIQEKLPDFSGFGVKYDPVKNPFFKAILVENLRIIERVAAGKQLLQLIADARPRHRADFPDGVNVFGKPKDVKYVESGHAPAFGSIVKVDGPGSAKYVAPKGCRHYIVGSSANASKSPTDSENGQGSVCDMLFTNAQFVTSKGERSAPFVVLAHELIHSYHCLYGIKKGEDEELWTTGIGTYADEALSENVFRTQFGMPPRAEYY